MRAFVAIEVPPTIRERMAAIQDRLRNAGAEASWTRPEGVHLTLKFLDEVREEQVPQIVRALSVAASGKGGFRLGIEGVGTFPNASSARVVWLGITGEVGQLAKLQAAVEQALVGLGLEPDDRPFTPHLTLARIKRIRKRDAWLKGLEALKNVKLPGFDVAAVSLIRSELRPAGAVYHEIGTVDLQCGSG
jgi:2'-5' RNA ligase